MKVSVRLISRHEYESGTIDSGVLYLVQDSHGILPYMGTEKVSIDSLSPQLQEEVGSILDPKVAAGESSVVSAQAAQIAAEASAAVAAGDLAATTGNIAVVEEKIERLKSLHVGTVESSTDRTEVSLSEDMALNFVLQKGDKGDKGIQGEKGDAFTYDDFTAEQLEGLRGPQGIQGEKGDRGIQGEKGDAFTYGDFTEEQLEGLRGPQGVQGEKGSAFTYADFTPEQLESLRGPQGAKGEKGDKGDAFEYSDFTPGQLEALRGPQGIQGEKGDPGEPQWGAIAGDISSQQDLQRALDGKAGKSTTLAGYGIADAYTKGEVDAKVSSVYRYKGSVATYAELPAEGNTVGDVWNVATADEEHGIKAGDNVAWTGDQWDALSGEVDLTPFALKAEAGTDHNHDARYVKLEGRTQVVNANFGIYDSYDPDPTRRNGPIIAKESSSIAIGGNLNNDRIGLNSGYLSATFEGAPSPNVTFANNKVEKFRFDCNAGTLNAEKGFKEAGVLLSDKYAAKSHTHAMGDITGLPASGGTAGQVLTKTATGAEWADAPSSGGGSGSASWGSISGTLANQTDLVAALARKQDSELAIESAAGTTLAVLPGKAYSWTLSGNGTLSLGEGWTAGSLSDSVILLSPGSYSVSCSGNITMVDSLQAGKMNICVVRWLGDRARLYVVDSEQLGTITAQPVTASGTVGTAMSVNLADYVTVSTGANASYAMASGSTLPSGLSLSPEGVLSGTPEAESSDSLTVDVTAAGCTPTTLALTMAITAASTAKDLGTWEVEYSAGGIVNSNISGTYTATEETVTTSYGTFPVYSNGKYKIFPLETYNSQALTSVQWAVETEVVADSMLSTLYCSANLVWSSQSPSADYVHVRFNNTGSSGTGPYVSVSTSGYSANTSSAPSYMYDGNYYLHSGSATGTDAVWKLDSPVAECYICQSGYYSAWSVLRDPATPSTVVNELVNNYYAGVSYTSTDGINVALANSVTYNGCTSQYHAS